MAAERHREQWERLFEQKKRELIEYDCHDALQIASFEELQEALHTLAREYSQTAFPDFINKLNPSLTHVKSFERAITSASQSQPVACLVWGTIQAVLESACQSSYAVEEMLDVVATLNESLPEFEHYLKLFPNARALQFHLQDIFDTYMDYCLFSIDYIKRSAITQFFRHFLSSTPQQKLIKTKETIRSQIKEFKRAAQEIEFKAARHHDIDTALSSVQLSDIPVEISDGDTDDFEFPISTVTLYRNYTFLGRDGVLKSMHETFRPNASPVTGPSTTSKHGVDPACCILHGLGGIGKTQTALEFTYCYREEYDAIFWVPSDRGHSLASHFANIGEVLHLEEGEAVHDGQSQARICKRVMQWLQTTRKKWLIVFDNVEDIADIDPYFPRGLKVRGDLIITTQKQDMFGLTDHFASLAIKNLTREEGSKLVFKYLQRDPKDNEEAEYGCRISDLVEGLPLALATIGGYLHQTASSVSNYYENLRKSSRAWEASAIGPARQYEKNLETVFDFGLTELPENARSLINMMAFLNPDHIPEDLFISNIGNIEIKNLSSEAELIDMIRILRKRQLVRRDTSAHSSSLSIHRTVQWSVLLNLSKDHSARWAVFRETFFLLRRNMPKVSPIDNPEPEKWAEFEKYVPQILSLRSHCLWPEPPVELPPDFAQVLSDMATYMWHAGLFAEGEEALYTADHILDDRNIGDKNPLRGNIHSHIGIFASFNGVSERDEAMARRYKARVARETAHKEIPKNFLTREDEIRRYNVESDLAFGYLQSEDLKSCEEVMDKCLKQYKLWGSEEEVPFEYLKYNHVMAYVLMSKGAPIDAIKSAKHAAALGEKCAGVMHPTTFLCRFTLSNLLFFAGDIDRALEEARAVLRGRSKVNGEFNHFTLESYSFVASLLARQHKYVEAEQMFLKCLDRRKWSVWNQEGVARAQFLYGKVLESLDRGDEAAIQLQQARRTRDHYLETYPQWLSPDEHDELVVFDQMVSIWAGRFTGKLKQDDRVL